MLSHIVSIIDQSQSHSLKSGALFCAKYKITDKECLEFLYNNDCFEDIVYINDLNDNEIIDLNLSIYGLSKLGFYYSFNDFLSQNRYKQPNGDYYIFDLAYSSLSGNNISISKYIAITNLISSLENIARHTYDDVDIKNMIIFREDKSLFVTFEYSIKDITQLKDVDLNKLNFVSEVFGGESNEKQLLYINELIDFLSLQKENRRFKYLLSHFSEFYQKCNDAYQFYLRDFSYNKLKIELDSKALEYTQKIQSIINEAQTKLIAIPTVFVLACATFNYESDLFTIKNVVTIISLFIFAIIIQQFINNQKSSLDFINGNIDSYKETFKNNNVEIISSKFNLVELELKKQQDRLFVVEVILWMIPIGLLILWLFLIGFSIFSYILAGFTLVSIIFKIII